MDKETVLQVARRFRVGSWLLGMGSAVILAVAAGLVSGYALSPEWAMTQKVRAMLPFPVAMVGSGSAASFSELADNLASVRRFYETQDFASLGMRVDFTTNDGKMRLKMREKEILNKMIEDEALRMLADARGIAITEDDASREIVRRLEEVGGKEESVKEKLLRLYGWDMREFEEKVVLPSLYEKALRERFEADTVQFSTAKAEAEEARKNLDDGRGFADVAKEFSDGRTAEKGGAMGWFSYTDLIAELQEPAKTQKIGEAGPVLESPLGFHIVLVSERKSENGNDFVKLSQIFIKKKTFGDWLGEEMRGMDIRVLSPEYEWSRDAARVEFADTELREFERKALEKSDGDASVF